MAKEALKYCIDIQKMCDIKGFLHAYFIDVNNVILACNKHKADFFHDIYGKDTFIGSTLNDLMGNTDIAKIEECYFENSDVIQQRMPKQSYNIWSIKDLYRLDMITLKMPIFDVNENPLGIFVVSHFLNKFSVKQAFRLGFTKRETECLFYLVEGYTAKEIAKAIQLSPRTIEGYIDNMKVKLNCQTTSELLFKSLKNDIKSGINTALNCNQKSESLNPVSDPDKSKSTYRSIVIEDNSH